MSIIEIWSRRPEKKGKNHVTIDPTIPTKILFHYPLAFPNKFLKAFPKTFSTEMKSTECPAKERKLATEEGTGGRNFASCTYPDFKY